MAFRGLQAESASQGNAHRSIAKELSDLVAGPFQEWAAGHKVSKLACLQRVVWMISQFHPSWV